MPVRIFLLLLAALPTAFAWTALLRPPLPLPQRLHLELRRPLLPRRSLRPLCCSSAGEPDSESRREIDGDGAIDVAVREAIDEIVQQELAELASQTPEEQEAALPTLLARVEARAADASEREGYQFGDITRTVVESTRSEVQRQMDADWNMSDIELLLKVALFLGGTAMAPVAGLAAMPAAALLATYGAVLKAELGVRAVQEVGTRLTERAVQGIADGVRSYTGKEKYKFGDITEATVRKVTKNDDYKFGDLTKGAVRSLTGKEEYKFGDITRSFMKAWKVGNEDIRQQDEKFDKEDQEKTDMQESSEDQRDEDASRKD